MRRRSQPVSDQHRVGRWSEWQHDSALRQIVSKTYARPLHDGCRSHASVGDRVTSGCFDFIQGDPDQLGIAKTGAPPCHEIHPFAQMGNGRA